MPYELEEPWGDSSNCRFCEHRIKGHIRLSDTACNLFLWQWISLGHRDRCGTSIDINTAKANNWKKQRSNRARTLKWCKNDEMKQERWNNARTLRYRKNVEINTFGSVRGGLSFAVGSAASFLSPLDLRTILLSPPKMLPNPTRGTFRPTISGAEVSSVPGKPNKSWSVYDFRYNIFIIIYYIYHIMIIYFENAHFFHV